MVQLHRFIVPAIETSSGHAGTMRISEHAADLQEEIEKLENSLKAVVITMVVSETYTK